MLETVGKEETTVLVALLVITSRNACKIENSNSCSYFIYYYGLLDAFERFRESKKQLIVNFS